HRVIAPHGRSASGKARRRERALDRVEVVARIENAGVFRTDRLRAIGGIVLAAARAFEVGQHGKLSLAERQLSVASTQLPVLGRIVPINFRTSPLRAWQLGLLL